MSVSSGKQGQQRGRTLAAKRGDVRLLTIIVLTCFILVWVLARACATQTIQQPQAAGPPVGAGQASSSPSSLPSPDVKAFVPPEAVLLETFEANLDGDSDAEIVLVFNYTDEQRHRAGIVVLDYDEGGLRKAWEANPPLDGAVAKAEVRDANRDGSPEVLLLNTPENQEKHVLCIYAWDGAGYVLLAPSGGPLEGQQCFTSAYYAPEFRNVDTVDVEEIVTYEDDPSHPRLLARLYYWDGKTYSYASWLVILARPRPSAEATR